MGTKDHQQGGTIQDKENDPEDLKAFIQKKKDQNKVLKKIIEKLNPQNENNNKK